MNALSSLTPLELLAIELEKTGLESRLIRDTGRPPWLLVTNPAAPMLAETITAYGGVFWWPWRQMIATFGDEPRAADRIARVLGTGPRP